MAVCQQRFPRQLPVLPRSRRQRRGGPNLTDDYYKNVKQITDIAEVIKNGAAGGSMPAWRTRLHPNEIVLMAAYVAGLRGKNLRAAPPEGDKIPASGQQAASRAETEKGQRRSDSSAPARPEGRVLSTLMEDGSRRWLHPRLAAGPTLRARRILAYVLIAVFTLLPYLKIHGKPAVLLGLAHREFTVFGFTFLPTDTLLLALALITWIVGICLVTALAGRVWCGWMCPQTVYMEFVFRPIERLFDGPPGARHRPGRKRTTPRTVAKYALYLLISAYLAHTFLAYFVGVEALAQWVRRSPLEHPVSFLVMLAVTGLMMFDFAYFREQACIVACPYGRFQSVMLDRDSLIVSYDPRRGEPRGKLGDRKADPSHGDCIDCGLCTDTCPTGIDIREGLQLECIACTQCIDACNGVMAADRQAQGTDPAEFAGRHRRPRRPLLRLRVVLYPALMLVLATVFLVVFCNKKSADVTVLQGLGQPYSETAAGEITNQVRVIIENRSGRDAVYKIEIAGDAPGPFRPPAGGHFPAGRPDRQDARGDRGPGRGFPAGHLRHSLRVSDDKTFKQDVACRLLGPVRRAAAEYFRKFEMSNTDESIQQARQPNRKALASLVLADPADQPDQHPHRLGRGDGDRRHARQLVRHRARLVSEGPALRADGPAAAREQPAGLVGPTRRRPAADRHEPAERDLHGFRPCGQAGGKRHGRSRGLRPSAGEQPSSSVLLPHDGGGYGATLAFEDPGHVGVPAGRSRRGPETFTQIVKREI